MRLPKPRSLLFGLIVQCAASKISVWASGGYRQVAMHKDGNLIMGNCNKPGDAWGELAIMKKPPNMHNDSDISIMYREISDGYLTYLIYQANNGSIMMNHYTCNRTTLVDDQVYTDVSVQAGLDANDILVPSSLSSQASDYYDAMYVLFQDKSQVVQCIAGWMGETQWYYQGGVSPTPYKTTNLVSEMWNNARLSTAFISKGSIFMTQMNSNGETWYVDAIPDAPQTKMSNVTNTTSDFTLSDGWSLSNWNASIGALSLVSWKLNTWSVILFYIGNQGSIETVYCNIPQLVSKTTASGFDIGRPFSPKTCRMRSQSWSWPKANLQDPMLAAIYDPDSDEYLVYYITDDNLQYIQVADWMNSSSISGAFTLPTLSVTATTATPISETTILSGTESSTQSSLSAGAKAGIAVGAISGVGALSFAVWIFYRRRRRAAHSKDTPPNHPIDGTGLPFLPEMADNSVADARGPKDYTSISPPPAPSNYAELPSETMEDVPHELYGSPIPSPNPH